MKVETSLQRRERKFSEKEERLGQWKQVFAWRTVELLDGSGRWLEFVQRRYVWSWNRCYWLPEYRKSPTTGD